MESDQRRAEACRIHHPTVGFLVDEEDKQTNAEGKHNGQNHIKQTDGGYVFQKAGLENIVETHDLGTPFQTKIRINPDMEKHRSDRPVRK